VQGAAASLCDSPCRWRLISCNRSTSTRSRFAFNPIFFAACPCPPALPHAAPTGCAQHPPQPHRTLGGQPSRRCTMAYISGASVSVELFSLCSLLFQGVRFAPGGIRKGAAGYDITFLHPKGSADAPISGEGVLIELVQAPADVIKALS
jgi:hypothetical protein